MTARRVTFFRQAPLEPGQAIHIVDGPRRGDWEVLAVDEETVTLRCPVSGRQVTWKRFCTQSEEREAQWPAQE